MKKPGESVVFKSIIGIIVPLILLSVIIGILGYRSFTDGMLELYETGAVEIANTARTKVCGDRVDAYAESEATAVFRDDDPVYQTIVLQVRFRFLKCHTIPPSTAPAQAPLSDYWPHTPQFAERAHLTSSDRHSSTLHPPWP